MMVVKRTISKETIATLPKVVFTGEIVVVQNEEQACKALELLNTHAIVGIDTETKPAFLKGQSHKVALLQISTSECCYLFRLNQLGLTKGLIAFLENPDILKIGLSLKDDFASLHKRSPFTQRGCIDLQQYVGSFGIQDKSLQKIYAILFDLKISKSQRLSNWESEELTEGQKRYAATDAWACYKIYQLLEDLMQTGNYCPEPPHVEDTIEDNN